MRFHRSSTIPVGSGFNPGDIYHVPVSGDLTRVNEYKIDENGNPRFVEGISLDQSNRLEQITQVLIDKLEGDYTRSQVDALVASAVVQSTAAYVPLNTDGTLPTPVTNNNFTIAGEGDYGGGIIVADGNLGILSWDGSVWALSDEVELPTAPVSDEIIENGTLATSQDAVFRGTIKPIDLDKQVGKNKFNKEAVIPNKYIDPTNGQVIDVSSSPSQISSPMAVGANNIVISGLGNIHHGLGWAFITPLGEVVRRGVAPIDSIGFSASGIGLSPDVLFHFTVRTTKTGDNTNYDNVQVEIGNISTEYEPYQERIVGIQGTGITVDEVITDSNNPYSPVNVEYLDDVAIKEDDFTLVPGKNIFNPVDFEDGYIEGTTGNLINNPLYKRTKPILITEKGLLAISGLGNIHHGLGYRFNKSDGSLASFGTSGLDVTNFIVNSSALDDVVSFQCTIKTGKPGDNTVINQIQIEKGGTPTEFEPYSPVISAIKGYNLTDKEDGDDVKTSGKKILFLGDSITTEDLGTINWPTFARPLLGITDYENYAQSGASFVDWTGHDNPRQQLSVQIEQAILDGYTPDIIVISIGTNDYSRIAVLGDYDTAMSKSTLSDLDRTKVLEAARYAFWRCRSQWGDAVCFYGNPLQRATTPNSSEADDNGDWLRNPIERMSRRYNFKIIDAYGKSGIVKDFEVQGSAGRFLTDGLHPNSAGKALQGKFYANEIILGFPG